MSRVWMSRDTSLNEGTNIVAATYDVEGLSSESLDVSGRTPRARVLKHRLRLPLLGRRPM